MSSQDGRGRLIRQTCSRALTEATNPTKVSWENLKFTVNVPTTVEERATGMGKTKKFDVLKGITGYALPGQTCYIMGASGAGKTSLMNILSARVNLSNGNTVTGSVLLNDTAKMNQDLFGNYGAYVM